MLGSIALMPIGFVIVGPLSDTVGIHPTLWIASGAIVVLVAATLGVSGVRDLRRLDSIDETGATPATVPL